MDSSIKNNISQLKNNSLIDLFKLIASVMIFIMHIGLFKQIHYIGLLFESLTRWGVPFFFITSAYLFFSKEQSTDCTAKYCKRVACLYGVWFVYNIPSIVYTKIAPYGYSIKTFVTFIINAVISSTYKGSWFLTSSIFCVIVFSFVLCNAKAKRCCIYTLPFQVLFICSSLYFTILPEMLQQILVVTSSPWNILVGLFYFALGKLVAENRDKWASWSNTKCFILAALMMGFFLLEVAFSKLAGFYRVSDQGIFIAPAALFLLLGCIKTDFYSKNGVVWRKLSTIIYCAQGNVLVASSLFAKKYDMGALGKCLIGVLMLACISVIVFFLQKKCSNKCKLWNYLT